MLHTPFRFSALLVACWLWTAALPATVCRAEDIVWQATAKTKLMVNSHTSYEFGNPLPPYQTPLSRLEFPVDSVWTGGGVRGQLNRVSIGVEFLTSLTGQESGRFKDSDWDDDAAPNTLTIYGETDCRMHPSYQVTADIDVEMADVLGLPAAVELRPVLGFRWQRFSFVAHDGYQYEYDTSGAVLSVTPLPGDVLSFRQDWFQPFLGVRLGYAWDDVPLLHRLKLTSQFDWGYAVGKNRDRHLLRGSRRTDESTEGDVRHVALGVILGLTENFDLGVEAEYLRIETTGTHTLYDSWGSKRWSHGVRAWSEQTSCTLDLTYRF